jgi:hypothetical protein
MHLRSVLFTSAAAAALYCTPSRQQPKPGVVCTLLGCSNGVIVHLAARPTTTFRVELIPAHGTDGTRYAFECQRADECPEDIMFPDIITESARVVVTTPAGTRETAAGRLVYTSRNPNGPRCGPECRQARITAEIPE